ncbi:hypothetical protein CFC21_014340 [Triticum aestivum]|uniref:Histone-lysine N-methyltransferase n=2 Tax=Triticum aestivum TaxID=4565 RepID=A0A3B6AP47_WHEAT|nr:uncharacterized protein LOC123186917 [Triticum aestivum]KAF6998202.1 hypothetical protein CFC21_014340 [Triticum aestivum]
MVDKAAETSQLEVAAEGVVLWDEALVKTSPEDLQMRCKELRCYNDIPVMCLKKDVNCDLEKDGLLPKIEAEVSTPAHQDSVPLNFGRNLAVCLDSKAGEIGEVSEHRTGMERAACGSQGGGMLSFDHGFWKGAVGDKNQFPRMEGCHENGGLSDLGNHDTDKFPQGADALSLIDDNHELGRDCFLANIDEEVSFPVDEALVPSFYQKSHMDVFVEDSKSCIEKLTQDSLEGDMLSCERDARFRTEASGDENQHRMVVSKGQVSSICEDANSPSLNACGLFPEIEVLRQQADKEYKVFELPPEIYLARSSYNPPCLDGLCRSGKESSAVCLGHQDSSGVKSRRPDHLVQELNAYNSSIDKPCSANFVENANDEESQNKISESLNASKRRNPRRAASSRNRAPAEHDHQINKGSSSTCKSKKVESSCSLVESALIKFPSKTTKVRSGINRPVNSTAWGSLEKLADGFGQNCEPSTSNSHLISLENGGRSNKRSGKKEQPIVRKARSSRCPKNKFPAFSVTRYAPDELNGEPTFSVMDGAYGSAEGYIGNFPKLVPRAFLNVSDDAHRSVQHMSIQTDMQQLDRCLDSVAQETCPAYMCGEFAKSISEPSLNNGGVGFSPDSVLEVASVTCENNTSASHDVKLRGNPSYPAVLTESDLHASDLSIPDFGKNHASSSTDFEQQPKTVRGDENTRSEEINQSHAIIGYVGEGKVQGLEKSNAVRKTKMLEKQKGRKKDGMKGNNIRDGSSTKISSSEASQYRVFSDDPSSLVSSGPLKFSSCFEVITSATHGISMHEHGWVQGTSVIGKEKTSALNNVKSPRCKKSGGLRGKKDMVRDPHVKQESKKKNIADAIFIDSGLSTLPCQLATNLATSHTNEQGYRSPAIEYTFQNPVAISTELPGNAAGSTGGASVSQPKRAAWACCDDCQKWRCIPSELADVIGENRWTCKDNDDKAFADCSIPQAKTNAEINAELELSDASADEADKDGSNSKASRAPSWTNLRSNTYLHRNRRNQSIDESMVCNCKPPQDGRMGCRDGCLNRMLNIECAKRTCPCEEQCSNQQFQRRNYAKIAWFHSGKKGYGLKLQEEVSEGRFLIEYVGEVLDITTYESRQRDYASKGKKHFYFMALDGGEVIDACTKGNLGRFINHSCSPNCRTEKWMVNGEVCIGIFAMRNIKKDEELTFDYNYVRVSGAAPQKCFCGTAKCRGYIGGDISGSGISTQHVAEAEYFEPMVTYKDAEEMLGNACSHGANPSVVELEHETSIQQEDSNNCIPVTPDSEPHQTSPILFENSELENSWEMWSPQDAEDPTRTPVHVPRTIDSTLQQLPVYDTQPLEFLPKAPNTMDGSKAPNVMNQSARSSDLGQNLVVPGFHAKKKNNLKDHRDVKSSSCSTDNENTLGVEARLNNLLDRDGGISRRKDSTNGYLRLLLFVTAAARDNAAAAAARDNAAAAASHDATAMEHENAATPAERDNAGGTSKSARDLSLILDALLKTKSRSVLLDIINTNGLQMLHNILKQNRDTFLRRPIIRKLLKVLEFLALKGILRAEKINEEAPREEMERFRDSMLKLTRHSDKQVQTIARHFCEKWIHPYMDGPVSTSKWCTDSYSNRRKRKSRWDYQPESHYKMVGSLVRKVYGELGLQAGLTRNRSQPVMGGSSTGTDDDVPPGFEPQQGRSVAPGFCLPNLNISYGIPIAHVQHLGTPEVEGGGNRGQKWKVAPGVPFIPFPQLQRGSPCPSTSTQMSSHDAMRQNNSSGYRGRGFDRGGRVQRNGRNGARTRYPYDHQGRRFPSNHHRSERWQPWPQEHDGGSGSRGRQ